jgi:hypothetical protein
VAGSLLAVVRAEPEAADRVATVPGMVALALAERVVDPTSSAASVATLSKELRVVLAEALAGTTRQRDALDDIVD